MAEYQNKVKSVSGIPHLLDNCQLYRSFGYEQSLFSCD